MLNVKHKPALFSEVAKKKLKLNVGQTQPQDILNMSTNCDIMFLVLSLWQNLPRRSMLKQKAGEDHKNVFDCLGRYTLTAPQLKT